MTTTCERLSPSGLSRTGFISTLGAVMAAAACTAWERPISPPSGVAYEFRDMFCALNGATSRPSCANMRQSAAASTDLPAWDEVPWTMMTPASPRLLVKEHSSGA